MENDNNNNNDNNDNDVKAPFDPMFGGLETPTQEGHFVPNDPEALERGSLECDFALAPSAAVGVLSGEATDDILELSLSDGEEKFFDEKEVAAKDAEDGNFRYGIRPAPIDEKPRCSSPGKKTEHTKTRKDKPLLLPIISLPLSPSLSLALSLSLSLSLPHNHIIKS